MKKFISIFSIVVSALSRFSGALLTLISISVCVHVILRGVFNSGITGIYEVVQYGMLIIVSLTLAENELSGGSIIVNFILDKMKPRVANIISIFMYCLTIGGMLIVLYYQIGMIVQNYTIGAVTPVLRIPRWTLVIMICIGLFFFIVAFIVRAYYMIIGHKDIENVKLTMDEKAASTQIHSEF